MVQQGLWPKKTPTLDFEAFVTNIEGSQEAFTLEETSQVNSKLVEKVLVA